MKINSKYIIIVLIVVIAILLWINIFKKSVVIPNSNEEQVQELLGIIAKQEIVIDSANAQTLRLEVTVKELHKFSDSLIILKRTIKHYYHEVYINIPSSSDNQLDSIIRANW